MLTSHRYVFHTHKFGLFHKRVSNRTDFGSLPLCQERRMMQMHPYILNINEDAQLSGMIKLFIQEGRSVCRTLSILR